MKIRDVFQVLSTKANFLKINSILMDSDFSIVLLPSGVNRFTKKENSHS